MPDIVGRVLLCHMPPVAIHLFTVSFHHLLLMENADILSRLVGQNHLVHHIIVQTILVFMLKMDSLSSRALPSDRPLI